MSTETFAELQARAQNVIDNIGGKPTAAPLATAADPSREKFHAQMEKAQADVADLRRPDGTPRHTPEEMIERRDQIRADVTEALTEYDKPLIEAQAAVQTELAELTDFDPNSILADLSADELARANGLKSFIQENVANLSAVDLAPAIEAAIENNDRPSLVLYLRELPARTEALGKKFNLAERTKWAKLENTIKAHVTPPDDGTKKALQKRYAELTLARSSAVRAAADGTPSVRF